MRQLRIGALGAARITAGALIRPAGEVAEVTVAAVAARDRARAGAFAAEHGIPVVHASYQDLLADPDIDAVYNPLPNSLHAHWTLQAISAGKHVLCEKPFSSNAGEAGRVAAAARDSGLVVMEAMHYRYHPLARYLEDLVWGASGIAAAPGTVQHIQCTVSFPLDGPQDIRYSYALGGGATMDAGCYAIDCIRLLARATPTVTAAQATARDDAVDRAMSASFRLPGGGTAGFDVAFADAGEMVADARVLAGGVELLAGNFIQPPLGLRLVKRSPAGEQAIPAAALAGAGMTFPYQLRAFAAAVLSGRPFPSTPEHAAVTMRLIDDVYRAAGLPARGADPGTR